MTAILVHQHNLSRRNTCSQHTAEHCPSRGLCRETVANQRIWAQGKPSREEGEDTRLGRKGISPLPVAHRRTLPSIAARSQSAPLVVA